MAVLQSDVGLEVTVRILLLPVSCFLEWKHQMGIFFHKRHMQYILLHDVPALHNVPVLSQVRFFVQA